MKDLVSGETSPAQISAALMALRVVGVESEQLVGFVEALRGEGVRHDFGYSNLVDTCGTGGGRASFNLSTTAAIMAAAAGAKIAKHGNRGVTSKCGSSDVLEALGVSLDGSYDHLKKCLDKAGLCFMFAPAHHPAMRHVGPVRKELAVRTVFNQLGPLLNPAGATRQVIGVYDPKLIRPMAEALAELGCERALVVHGLDDMDEISPCADTAYAEVKDGVVTEGRFSPEDFGIKPQLDLCLTPGETADENAEILREAIANSASPRFMAALPDAAAAVMLSGVAGSLKEGAMLVKEAVDGSQAVETLEALAKVQPAG